MSEKLKRIFSKPLKYFKIFARQPIRSGLTLFYPKLNKVFNARYKENPYESSIDKDGLTLLLQNVINSKIKPITIDDFISDPLILPYKNDKNAERLAKIFQKNQSDKSNPHDYHHIYQPILDDILSRGKNEVHISEIGLGTYNLDVLSNMGVTGMPGASLRSFKEYSNDFILTGGDIDERILFNEENIQTYKVDQIDISSLKHFSNLNDFDLMIDDGLHTAHSAINFLACALDKLKNKKDSYILIEDIDMDNYEKIWINLIKTFDSIAYTWLIKTKEIYNKRVNQKTIPLVLVLKIK